MGGGENILCTIKRLALWWSRQSKRVLLSSFSFFFFNDTATTEIYTLSLHDALPISGRYPDPQRARLAARLCPHRRSEEHTSELQSPVHLVCRLLLEKKKKTICKHPHEKKTQKKKKHKKSDRLL